MIAGSAAAQTSFSVGAEWTTGKYGEPEKTDTLAKFYPTTDLVTGPDIIFF